MSYWIINLLALAGAFFTLVAAIGMLRLPDFYCRMHAATKAGAFGGTLLLLAAALVIGEVKSWVIVLATVGFFYATAPIAGHLLSRAALRNKVPLFRKGKREE